MVVHLRLITQQVNPRGIVISRTNIIGSIYIYVIKFDVTIFVFLITKMLPLLLLSVVNAEIVSPVFGSTDFKDKIISAINSSQVSIIATIYKFDNEEIFNAFWDAGVRGVEMKIICDSTAYKRCSYLHYFGLIQQFNMKGYDKLHAKSILIDGKTLILGSFNLDNSGFSTNMEIGLITNDTSTVEGYINFIRILTNN